MITPRPRRAARTPRGGEDFLQKAFAVDDPAAGKEILGDYVEIVATRVGPKTLHVTSVKVLKPYVAKCDVP